MSEKKITKLYLVEDIYLKIFDGVELDGIVWIGLLCKGSNSAIIKKKWKMAILRDVWALLFLNTVPESLYLNWKRLMDLAVR